MTSSLWGDRPPRYGTAPTPGLTHRRAQVEFVARVLGGPLMAHQSGIAQITTQMNPPGSWLLWRYQLVVILMPRQTGKTYLTNPILVDRAQMERNRQILTTAQMGKDAAARWTDLADRVEADTCPLNAHVATKRGNGQELLTFPNRSRIRPFAPGPTAGHGWSPETVLIDEAWSFDADEAAELTTGLFPAMQTKRDRQVWIISAAGTQQSEWLNELIEAGRRSVTDPRSTMAYFEWSADPADREVIAADPAGNQWDPDRFDAAMSWHPGLNGLITPADLRAARAQPSMSAAAFLRNYANLTAARGETVIDLEEWDKLAADDVDTPDPDSIALAYDVAVDRSSAAIWAAWRDHNDRIHLRVWQTGPGAEWVPGAVADAWNAGRIGSVCADDGGPARAVTDHLVRAGVPVKVLPGRDAATAWAAFKAHVTDADHDADAPRITMQHDGSPALRSAIEVAAERRIRDLRILDRTASRGPIDALIAATVAAWYAGTATVQVF